MMTLRFAKCAVAVGAIGLAAVLPSNAQAASTTATAAAVVATAIGIANTVDMDFGSITEAGAGTVVLATDGSRTTTGGVSLLAGGPGAAASFDVTGQANQTYSITLPGSVTLDSGGNTMTANTFVSLPTPTGTLNGAGTETLLIGATLIVGAGQATGSYLSLSAFTMTVNYN